MKRIVLVLCAIVGVSQVCGAQFRPANETPNIYFKLGAGGGRADSTTGVLVNAAMVYRSNWITATFSPIELLVNPGTSNASGNRYNGSQSQCGYDGAGKVSVRGNCGAFDWHWSAVADFALRVPATTLMLGGGGALSDHRLRPVGTASIYFGDQNKYQWLLRAVIGNRYGTGELAVSLH